MLSEHPGETVYILHELVHNREVTERMRRMGACFVERAEEIPEESLLMIGAHGCSADEERACRQRTSRVVDATCPVVRALQEETCAASERGVPLILLMDPDHQEARSILGRLGDAPKNIYLLRDKRDLTTLPVLSRAAFFSQTSRSGEEISEIRAELLARIDTLEDFARVCPEVLSRQRAMAEIAPRCRSIFVVGSPHSANARRLLAIAESNAPSSCRVQFLESSGELPRGISFPVGVGSATSADDRTVQEILTALGGLLPDGDFSSP